MAQSEGYSKTTVTMRIDTWARIDDFIAKYGGKKQEFVSNALDYIMSKPVPEIIKIGEGHMTAKKMEEEFERMVMDALQKIQRQKSDPEGSSGAKPKPR
jgi:hypothetical protein